MQTSLSAADHPANPVNNAAVAASAGSGKTYLLVTRIIRLLLAGAEPGNILAVTFTRKAANEMLARVQQRLWLLASSDERQLDQILQQDLQLGSNAAIREKAQSLYEQVLFAEPGLRITTFHAFCQELLQRFALEADIPPAFELTEQTYINADAAWDTLFAEATQQTDHPISLALETLFTQLNGLGNTRKALFNAFLQHRSDWWAYTNHSDDPIAYACEQAKAFFQPTTENPVLLFLQQQQQQQNIAQFLKLAAELKQKTYQDACQQLHLALDTELSNKQRYTAVQQAFLTQTGGVRKRTASGPIIKQLGDAQAEQLINIHQQIAQALLANNDMIKRNYCYELHCAWYLAGQHLLQHYQSIKRSQRQLDFTDLEWLACQLLNDSDHALWVQYKLDSRIDHLLVDEFQDTNPTQWRLLQPLLEEMASGNQERLRSAFIVGDDKQSIYSFRRANPELQTATTEWMQQHLQAKIFPLNKSWRSSPAITRALNAVFQQAEAPPLANYVSHDTYQQDLWGQVECWPLFADPITEDNSSEANEFRNPLTTPRYASRTTAHDLEAQAIAQQIKTLIASGIAVGTDNKAIDYDDIYILLRKRTHAAAYEQALAEHDIPFIGTETGTLLDCQEVDDVLTLLQFLVTPFNDLALAQLLKSPIFGGNDNDLIQLAGIQANTWYERLQSSASTSDCSQALQYANSKLQHWHELASTLPVHDLLDFIFHDGQLPARYQQAMPTIQQSRALANLHYLLELSLAIDSGRYPGIMRFLGHIEKLKAAGKERPDSLQDNKISHRRVQIMTVHAAKGLEAPIVFIADSHSQTDNKPALSAYVDWPTQADKPKHLLLIPDSHHRTQRINSLLEQQQYKAQREDANLLYVAMSRAVNQLYISGCTNKRQSSEKTWYDYISIAIEDKIIQHQTPTLATSRQQHTPTKNSDTVMIEKILCGNMMSIREQNDKRINVHEGGNALRYQEVSPSYADNRADGWPSKSVNSNIQTRNMARFHGIVVHRFLEALSQQQHRISLHDIPSLISQQTLDTWQQEARAVIEHKDFAYLFDSQQYQQAFNEIPVLYQDKHNTINGIIDRLVISDTTAWVIDYKTQAVTSSSELAQLSRQYQQQMAYYVNAARLFFPAKHIRSQLLFTHSLQTVNMAEYKRCY